MEIKVALPKGRLMAETAALLEKAGWGLKDYHEKSRLYRLKSESLPQLSAKIFHEKDVPIQVAIGNYDLGICGSDWIEELLVKYPSSAVLKEESLAYGDSALYIAASSDGEIDSADELKNKKGVIRIASEYPNLAESFALKSRLKKFSVFPLWGASEAYPPESADLALVFGTTEEIAERGLMPLSRILSVSAFLIANRQSRASKDMGKVVSSLYDKVEAKKPTSTEAFGKFQSAKKTKVSAKAPEDTVRLAIPDGHQQLPTLELLNKAGISLDDYPSKIGNRRPNTNLEGVSVKVIRPQDMPLQVASGNFDLAITGQDWLAEHLYQFPTSPVTELLNLKSGKVKIVAVVNGESAVNNATDLRQFNAKRKTPLRVASEYVNIADKYARDNHLGLYRVIPTWGATEAFLPEDADLLIENTQTGQTLAKHDLKIIDTLFESTACLIGSSKKISSPAKRARIESIIKTLKTAVEDI